MDVFGLNNNKEYKMDFVEKYYVGFQKNRYNTSETQRLLGFITPKTGANSDGDSAFKKRKSTVDSWREKDIAPREIDNTPQHGFQIVDTATRYSTSNKLFRVLDPRGFELEISSENLFDIIKECGIVRGLITDPMLWARHTQKPYLISGNSEAYKEYLKGPKKPIDMIPGTFFKHLGANIIYRYEGKFAYNFISCSTDVSDPHDRHGYYGYYGQPARTDYTGVTTQVTVTVDRKMDKLVTVFTQYVIREDGEVAQCMIHIRKSPFKGLVPIDTAQVPDSVKVSSNLKFGEVLTADSSIGSYDTKYILFETRKKALTAAYTQSELETICSPYRNRNGMVSYGTINFDIEYKEPK